MSIHKQVFTFEQAFPNWEDVLLFILTNNQVSLSLSVSVAAHSLKEEAKTSASSKLGYIYYLSAPVILPADNSEYRPTSVRLVKTELQGRKQINILYAPHTIRLMRMVAAALEASGGVPQPM
ncbi:hypothetical protein [Hymenobacter sp. 102]|uniref:hypothetical protein n=1 Tax=Hymenobacter sp. 102 TaxID=3403152 RepID=UPI003CEC6557